MNFKRKGAILVAQLQDQKSWHAIWNSNFSDFSIIVTWHLQKNEVELS